MKAFFVLGFNLLLLIVISGSLMYLAEGGIWDPDNQKYMRGGRFYNEETGRIEDGLEESPFLSIPHCFWWSIVTATTVGYGDVYPTTSMGYIIAVGTMVISCVILALPVGVIGGSFSKNWKSFDHDERTQAQDKAQETAIITSSLQKIDPFSMSSLMLVEVWNDRFPTDHADGNAVDTSTMPPFPEFMGQVVINLDLPPDGPTITRHVTKQLDEDPSIVKRPSEGSLTLRYDWTPRPRPDHSIDAEMTRQLSPAEMTSGKVITPLYGTLTVTLVSAEKLINLDMQTLHSESNPFCTVVCYPDSPEGAGDILRPCIWRSATVLSSLGPQWQSSHVFEFAWDPDSWSGRKSERSDSPSRNLLDHTYGRKPLTMDARLDEAFALLKYLKDEMIQVSDKVDVLTDRVQGVPARLTTRRVQGVPLTVDLSRTLATRVEGR